MRLPSRWCLIALPLVFLTFPTAAADPSSSKELWQPPAPDPTEKDWVRMSSGEWLRGSLEQIHDGDVTFDSDDLDDLDLDWDDIVEIRSPRLHTYRFDGREIVTGTLLLKDGGVPHRYGR